MLASTIKFSKHTPQNPSRQKPEEPGDPQRNRSHQTATDPSKPNNAPPQNMVKANVPPRNQKHDQPPETTSKNKPATKHYSAP